MDAYLWLKSLHIISVIAWMAGMLYLPRLFVYHAQQTVGSEASATFKIMERRLLKLIMNPAMIVVFVSGFLLIWELGVGVFQEGWLHAKLMCVVGLAALHGMFARWQRQFADDENKHSDKFYRVMNEVPTVLMIAIVILVVVKPF